MDTEDFSNDHSLDELGEQTRVVPQRDHFPLCVVWCPLPIFSWFFPIIGHIGITTSDGTIFDFQGDRTVHVCRTIFSPHSLNPGPALTCTADGTLAQTDPHVTIFGPATKYWEADLLLTDAGALNAWDEAIHESKEFYSTLHVCHR